MLLREAIEELHRVEIALSRMFRATAERHAREGEIWELCARFAEQSARRARELDRSAPRYGRRARTAAAYRLVDEVARLARGAVSAARGRASVPGVDLLLDLRGLYLRARDAELGWELLGKAAHAARDRELMELASAVTAEQALQIRWIESKLKENAPQVLVFS